MKQDCVLCREDGGRIVWQGRQWRLVHADEAANAPFPAFYRLIWNRHVAEWSDLSVSERQQGMEAVTLVEQLLREHLRPTKINMATLGNVVPHLHWHVIPRYTDDRHFPEPVWGQPQRVGVAHPAADAVALARAIDGALSAGH